MLALATSTENFNDFVFTAAGWSAKAPVTLGAATSVVVGLELVLGSRGNFLQI